MLIAVPEAESVVGRHRALYDPVAAGGVPAHITLVVPWVPPDEITEDDLRGLKECLKSEKPFDYRLTSVGWFEDRVMWLRPEPSELFIELITSISERFSTPPWGGEFAQVVPHLTVAHNPATLRAGAESGGATGSAVDLGQLSQTVEAGLPLRCRANEVLVMIGDGVRWYKRASFILGGATPLGESGGPAPRGR